MRTIRVFGVPQTPACGGLDIIVVVAYRIDETLRPDATWRAIDSADNSVVLKKLDPACLQHGRLHPNVKERLARIRELPLRDLAVLHGVEVIDEQPVLVWDYLEGETLEQFVRRGRPPTLARDLTLLIDALHGHGIVHGAIHARNIIVDPSGRPRLTHFSPLLHHDPALDRDDLSRLLTELNCVAAAEIPAMPRGESSLWRVLLVSAAFWLAVALAAASVVGGFAIYRMEQKASTSPTLSELP